MAKKIKRKKKKIEDPHHSGRLNRCLDCDTMWNSGNAYCRGFSVKNSDSPTASDGGFVRSSGPFVSSDAVCINCDSNNVVEHKWKKEAGA